MFEIQAFRLSLSAHPLAWDIEYVLMINVTVQHLHHFKTRSTISAVKIKIAYNFKYLTGIFFINFSLHIYVKKLVMSLSITLKKIIFRRTHSHAYFHVFELSKHIVIF